MEKSKRKRPVGAAMRRWRKRTRRSFRGFFERVMVALMGQLIPRLSRRMERRLAHGIGGLLFVLGWRLRRIGRANLDIVYGGTKSPGEKAAILRASYRHTALVMLDYFWFSRRISERLAAYCRTDNSVMEAWIEGRFPGILVTAHLGNWELAGQYVTFRGRGLWSVYRPIGTKWTLRTLLRFRQATGQQVLVRDGAMRGMLRALHAGDLVAALLDQHTHVRDGGIYLDFFGLPATFSNAVGVLAHRLCVPVCVACACHDAETDTYQMKVYAVISGEEAGAMAPEAITGRIVAAVSRMILDNPEQWLWSYRRWKRYRPDDDPSRFPFYARKDVWM